MLKVLLSRLPSLWMPALVAVVLLCAIGVIAYVQIAVKRIEGELPLRVMQEKGDMERVARNFYEFLAATEAAQAHPTEGNVASTRAVRWRCPARPRIQRRTHGASATFGFTKLLSLMRRMKDSCPQRTEPLISAPILVLRKSVRV